MTVTITSVQGRRIWDSRGRPTVEVEIGLSDGVSGRGMAPAGASRGDYEAVDLRDGGDAFGGWDVTRAIAGVNGEIAGQLRGMPADQSGVDRALIELDGTPNKSRLGGNATVATSMALLRALAASAGLPVWRYLAKDAPVRLPLPEIQIFGGGAHAGRRVDIQDFLITPIGAESFAEALDMTARVYTAAGRLLAERGPLTGVADEGGYWPNFDNNEDALGVLTRAIEKAKLAGQVVISLDIAASEFHRNGRYELGLEQRSYDTGEWIELLAGWLDRYPILSIEDPVGQHDRDGMIEFTRRFGKRVQIIGDDYLVTSAGRVEAAQADGACNAVLLKPNQVGTITETHATLAMARRKGWGTIVSARSGETEDDLISDLSTGWDAGQLKVGSFTRSERMSKWNRCLRIEDELGNRAVFAGRSALPDGVTL